MRHRWTDWRWAAVVAVILLAAALIVNGVAAWRGAERLGTNTDVVNRLQEISEQNHAVLQHIDSNQSGIDALVAFVNDVKSRPQDPQTAAALKAIIDTEKILCTSPQFAEQCREAGVPVG